MENLAKEGVVEMEQTRMIRENLDWILGNNFFTEKMPKHWYRLPREVVEQACRHGIWGHGLATKVLSGRGSTQ